MTRRAPFPDRRAFYALACSLELILAACGGGGAKAASAPPAQSPPATQTPAPDPNPPPGPTQQPPAQPPPTDDAGITGTYVLIRINDSQPGQLVSLANPDGKLIGLYRFDAATQITLDELQTFDLAIFYTDDKVDDAILDQGEFVNQTPPGPAVGLTFTSAVFGDKFFGVAGGGLVDFEYDFDGDGRTDTVFQFQRAGG